MGGFEIVMRTHDLEHGSPLTVDDGARPCEKRSVPASPYYDEVIKPGLQHQPWLENLHQFMDPTTPGFGVDLSHRMKHFDIKVIQISISGAVDSITHCNSPETFYQAIDKDQERSGTLVISKDISRSMIETLGTQYKLEPEFFANHLLGTESYRMGRWEDPTLLHPARAPNLLPDYLRKASFYTGEFRRPYHIEGGVEEVVQLRKRRTCTPRGVQVKGDIPSAFGIEKISVYRKPGSKIGIILTDQLLSPIPAASYLTNPVTSLSSIPTCPTHTTLNAQTSSRHTLVAWLESLSPSERLALFTNDQEALALRPILKLIECSTDMFLTHARHTMARILTQHTDAAFQDSVSLFLGIWRSLYRHINGQQKLLRLALRLADRRGGGGPGVEEQMKDLGELGKELEAVLKALEEDMRFLVAVAQIQEGRIVGWVSKFAALFLPVSLLATILAISDPGYTRWAILGGLSMPFVAVSAYLMFFWRPKGVDNSMF